MVSQAVTPPIGLSALNIAIELECTIHMSLVCSVLCVWVMQDAIDWSISQTVYTDYRGDGTLPSTWDGLVDSVHSSVNEYDGGLFTAVIYSCPFAYAAYYGDVGQDGCSGLMTLADAAMALLAF